MSFQVAAAFAVTSFAGTLMYLHGVSLNLFARRRTRCRTCGGIPGRTCNCDRDR